MLGVRDTVDDCFIRLRNMFDMSEFVELLETDTKPRVSDLDKVKSSTESTFDFY